MTLGQKEKEPVGGNERETGSRVAKHNNHRQPVTCPLVSSLSLLVVSPVWEARVYAPFTLRLVGARSKQPASPRS